MEPAGEMPEPIAAAVNQVMRRVGTLLRSERNETAGYRFASIDGFLSAVNPLCARAGLIILQDEREARLVAGNDATHWLWVTFAFTLAHRSGVLWGPVTRSVMVPAGGPQAFGAAQSYALKQVLRTLFQIPTGDGDDADHAVVRPGAAGTGPTEPPLRIVGTVRRGQADRVTGAAGEAAG